MKINYRPNNKVENTELRRLEVEDLMWIAKDNYIRILKKRKDNMEKKLKAATARINSEWSLSQEQKQIALKNLAKAYSEDLEEFLTGHEKKYRSTKKDLAKSIVLTGYADLEPTSEGQRDIGNLKKEHVFHSYQMRNEPRGKYEEFEIA